MRKWFAIGPVGTALAGALALGPAPVPAAAAPSGTTVHTKAGTTYFVDCANGSDNADGTTESTAWRSLARANSVTFAPGDKLRLRAGTTCRGTLAPKGSGDAKTPVSVEPYGRGAAPVVDGAGASAAVLLENVEYYQLRKITVTNTGATAAQRAGIRVLLRDFGIGHHYVIDNVTVRDVNGTDKRYPNPSGGILFEAAGTSVPTGFSGIAVTDTTVDHVDRTGIGITSDWQKRTENPKGPGTTFVPNEGIVISRNTVKDIGGDGIILFNGNRARVTENTVDGFNIRSTDYNIGAYAWNADRTIFEHNTVRHGKGPGMAFAVEGGNIGTTYQYNYSQDNGGGFLYFCQDDGEIAKDGVVRYNISQNDAADAQGLGLINSFCTGVSNLRIYQNTLYAPNASSLVKAVRPNDVTLQSNVFVGRKDGSTVDDPYGTYRYNLFHRATALPPNGDHNITGDPLLTAPGSAVSASDADGYRLRTGSPALNAGSRVTGDGGKDFYGNPVPAVPHIGAYQGAPQ
ncbi:right-handed parallel beta-helix repeat-containing protein [Streptomyces chrestomyceticus]|uniref:right-handed parallel beta-helix repeat-containing protein n=1 Tax=Streptomyces chrestomyceticus TaxID=68185 RepID=UPI0019D00E41|nr:right-handed parallel beta-helix repeat-containing protein [Streptomyces chrestomyceticus]